MDKFAYWYFLYVLASTSLLILIFIWINSHVWVRGGYEGKNKQLELHEVDRFKTHILGEFCALSLYMVVMMEPLTFFYLKFRFPLESKLVFTTGSIASGIYIAISNRFKKLSDGKSKNDNDL